MKILDLDFPSPAEDLACDEALLDAAEASDSGQVLRFWQPTKTFVVLGYSNAWKEEVKLPTHIPILRRCSGGGTVLQAAGCLNYSLFLRIKSGGATDTIHSTNEYVMRQNRLALEKLLDHEVRVQGHTDLTLGPLKFSGNAQRRKRKYLLFHGTFLLNLDLALLEKILKIPETQPAYRGGRTHGAFVTNLKIPAEKIKRALAKAWCAEGVLKKAPTERIEELVRERYSKDSWNLKF